MSENPYPERPSAGTAALDSVSDNNAGGRLPDAACCASDSTPPTALAYEDPQISDTPSSPLGAAEASPAGNQGLSHPSALPGTRYSEIYQGRHTGPLLPSDLKPDCEIVSIEVVRGSWGSEDVEFLVFQGKTIPAQRQSTVTAPNGAVSDKNAEGRLPDASCSGSVIETVLEVGRALKAGFEMLDVPVILTEHDNAFGLRLGGHINLSISIGVGGAGTKEPSISVGVTEKRLNTINTERWFLKLSGDTNIPPLSADIDFNAV